MKQISQNYFDEMVAINMELLDLSLEDVIEETCHTFTLEDHIAYSDGHPTEVKMKMLTTLVTSNELLSPELISCIEELTTLSCIDLAHRHALIKLGAFNQAFNLLQKSLLDFNYQCAVPISKLLGCLLVGQIKVLSDEELSVLLEETNFLLVKCLLENFEMCDESVQVLSQFLSILRTSCLKNEPVRSKISKNAIVDRILKLLSGWSNSTNETLVLSRNKQLLQESCSLLRALTLDDDMSVEFGDGAATARSIASADKTIQTFLKLTSNPVVLKIKDILAELLLTLSTFITREEFCVQFMENGGIDVLFNTLATHFKNPVVVASCLALMRAVCSSDKCKRSVSTWNIPADSTTDANHRASPCEKITGVQFLLQVLERYISSSPAVCKNVTWVLAAITLRQPDIAEMVVSAGAPHLLGQVLHIYLKHPSIVRAVCMAIRNCVCRTPELRSAFVPQQQSGFDSDPDAHGIEEHLNKALQVAECADEAKAALRDLGCPVVLRELWVSAQKKVGAS